MNLPDHIHPVAVEEALLNIGMSIDEIRALANTPEPQIIRTLDEIEALDPETMLMEVGNFPQSEAWTWIEPETGKATPTLKEDLPVVVVTPGAQVRAARTALQEATE